MPKPVDKPQKVQHDHFVHGSIELVTKDESHASQIAQIQRLRQRILAMRLKLKHILDET
mgnify:CR=1 FL=1